MKVTIRNVAIKTTDADASVDEIIIEGSPDDVVQAAVHIAATLVETPEDTNATQH
jgi:hypothetical protein